MIDLLHYRTVKTRKVVEDKSSRRLARSIDWLLGLSSVSPRLNDLICHDQLQDMINIDDSHARVPYKISGLVRFGDRR